MKIQLQAHQVKHRNDAKDVVYTPRELAAKLIALIKLQPGERVLDPCRGVGAFYEQFPSYVFKDWCEIADGSDFFKYDGKTDWIISNPPYSCLNDWLEQSCKTAEKGFGYLIGTYSITPVRLELIESYGFHMTKMHYFKVGAWFGTQCFVVFEKVKNAKVEVTYDRKVYKAIARNKIDKVISKQKLLLRN